MNRALLLSTFAHPNIKQNLKDLPALLRHAQAEVRSQAASAALTAQVRWMVTPTSMPPLAIHQNCSCACMYVCMYALHQGACCDLIDQHSARLISAALFPQQVHQLPASASQHHWHANSGFEIVRRVCGMQQCTASCCQICLAHTFFYRQCLHAAMFCISSAATSTKYRNVVCTRHV